MAQTVFYATQNAVDAGTGTNSPQSLGTSLADSGTGLDVTNVFSFNMARLVTAQTFLTGDVVQLALLPKGAIITDYSIKFPILDTSTGISISLGLSIKASSTQAFVAAAVGSRSSALITITPLATLSATTLSAPATTIAQVLPYPALTADDILILTATAGCTTAGAGGTIQGWIRYNMRGQVF